MGWLILKWVGMTTLHGVKLAWASSFSPCVRGIAFTLARIIAMFTLFSPLWCSCQLRRSLEWLHKEGLSEVPQRLFCQDVSINSSLSSATSSGSYLKMIIQEVLSSLWSFSTFPVSISTASVAATCHLFELNGSWGRIIRMVRIISPPKLSVLVILKRRGTNLNGTSTNISTICPW